MTGYEAYKTFVALKNHFQNDTYDYFKYKGKTTVSFSAFEKRKDKFQFERLAKIKDVDNYIISNIIRNNSNWVGDLLCEEGKNNYTLWLKFNQSLQYNFQLDLQKLKEDFNSNLICVNGQYPYLLKLSIGGNVNLETVIILDGLCDFISYWNKTIKDECVWPEIYKKIIKYKPFIDYDKVKLKEIVKAQFN